MSIALPPPSSADASKANKRVRGRRRGRMFPPFLLALVAFEIFAIVPTLLYYHVRNGMRATTTLDDEDDATTPPASSMRLMRWDRGAGGGEEEEEDDEHGDGTRDAVGGGGVGMERTRPSIGRRRRRRPRPRRRDDRPVPYVGDDKFAERYAESYKGVLPSASTHRRNRTTTSDPMCGRNPDFFDYFRLDKSDR